MSDTTLALFFGITAALVIQVVCAALGSAYARSIQRDSLTGALLGFLLGPLGIMLLAIAGPAQPNRR